jgi:hypothetical protein
MNSVKTHKMMFQTCCDKFERRLENVWVAIHRRWTP